MKRLVLSAVAVAAVLTAVPTFTAVPAFADDYDGPGFSFHLGRDHDWDRDRGWRHERRFDRRDRNECRQVTVRERLPNGNVVVRKHFRC